MNELRAVRIGFFVGCAGLLLGCAVSARTPVFVTYRSPAPRVCANGEIEFCERLSAFVWSQCECLKGP